MKVISIVNLKGGVAKTTTAVNLAALLARDHDKRVLLIDADSQGNTTGFYRSSDDRKEDTLADLLRMPKSERTEFSVSFSLDEVIRPSCFDGVDLLPADNTLMDLDLTKVEDDRVFTAVLKLGLPRLSSRYDAVIIDCPPAFNAASAAALLASDHVLIPVKLDAFALEGLGNLLQQVANMRKINPSLSILGILPVMWYKSELIRNAERQLRDSGLPILPRIRRSDKVDVMTFRQAPLIDCAPKCGACRDYRVLAKRLLQPTQTGKEASA